MSVWDRGSCHIRTAVSRVLWRGRWCWELRCLNDVSRIAVSGDIVSGDVVLGAAVRGGYI